MEAPQTMEAPVVHQDGIETIGDQVVIFCDSVAYPFLPPQRSDYAFFREKLTERRRNPMRALVEEMADLRDLPEHVRESIRKEMLDRHYAKLNENKEDKGPTPEDVGNWIANTESGSQALVYVMLRHGTPGLTEEKAAYVVSKLDKAVLEKNRDELGKKLVQEANQMANKNGSVAAVAVGGPAN